MQVDSTTGWIAAALIAGIAMLLGWLLGSSGARRAAGDQAREQIDEARALAARSVEEARAEGRRSAELAAEAQLALLKDRIASAERERVQQHTEFLALRTQADQWRSELDTARDDRAQLTERAARVPVLDAALAHAQDEAVRLNGLMTNLRGEASGLQSALAGEREALATLRSERADLHTAREALHGQVGSLRGEVAELTTRLDAERGQSQEKLALLQAAGDAMKNEFKTLATDILEEKSKRFTEQNATNLGQLLDPLRTRLQDFQGKVELFYDNEGKQRSALQQQVTQLMDLNRVLSDEARNLTQALKGSNKAQGNWGELILERVLEASGLRRDFEYYVQQSHPDAEGRRQIPDVIVHLPEERKLVIDAKVSLLAYEQCVRAETDEARAAAQARHLQSVRQHIKGLSAKNYQELYSLKSLDFVLMFIPVEPAFMLAIQADDQLFMDAWQRNVLLVSPSTLLFVVRTVEYLWRQEAQSQNAQAIADKGRDLYNKLAAFVDDLEDVGKAIDKAQKAYGLAYGKLVGGKGNAIRQAEMLKQLGVKPTKNFSAGALEGNAAEEQGDGERDGGARSVRATLPSLKASPSASSAGSTDALPGFDGAPGCGGDTDVDMATDKDSDESDQDLPAG
jgi:DNA recombination protein RmuC